MSWSYSTGFKTEVMSGHPTTDVFLIGDGIALTTDSYITDTGSGLAIFDVGDWVRVVSASNKNAYGRVTVSAAGQLTFAASTFAAESAGTDIFIEKVAGSSYTDIFQNCRCDLYTGGPPASADATETGTFLGSLTLSSGTFVSGTSTNGLNFGQYASGYLKRAIDPATGVTEVWSGDGEADGTAGWGRVYANTVVTGASTSAVRKDGTVTTTTGGDIVMAGGRGITTAAPFSVTDIAFYAAGV